MPTTTNGLPYPAAVDPPNGSLQIQQLAEAVDPFAKDTTWLDIPKAAIITGGVLKYRVLGKVVYVFINVTANTNSGATVPLSSGSLPVGLWPSVGAFAGGNFAGFAGVVFVGNSGDVSCIHNSGAARGTVAGTISYPLGI